MYTCNYCGKTFTRKFNLQRHQDGRCKSSNKYGNISKNITETNQSTNLPVQESKLGIIPSAVIEDKRLTFDSLPKGEIATHTWRYHNPTPKD